MSDAEKGLGENREGSSADAAELPADALASTPEEASANAPETPTETQRILPATSGRPARPAPRLSDLNPRHFLLGILALLAIGVASAFAGITLANLAIDAVSDANSLFSSETQGENLSTPQSSWKQGTTPQLYQTDQQWALRPYGSSTIGAAGAAPCCLAMAHICLTGDVETGPVEIASFAQNNGFAKPGKTTALLTEGAEGIGLCAKQLEASEMALRSEINRGHPVICATLPKTFDERPSFIVLTRIDENSRLVIRDPLSEERTKKHWKFEEILACSAGLWSYTLAE